jgi:hypothetical protein
MIPNPEQFNEQVEVFLTRQIAEERNGLLVGSVVFYLGCAFASFVTFWLLYLVLVFSVDYLFQVPHNFKMALCVAGLVGIFWQHRRTPADYYDEYPLETTDGGPPMSIYIPQVGLASNLSFTVTNLESLAKMIVTLLFIAPHLAAIGKQASDRRLRLAHMDLPGCGALLGHLLTLNKKISFRDLSALFPHLDLSRLLPQLGLLDGIVFLRAEPPGISLTGDLRAELRAAVLGVVTPPPPEEPAATAEPEHLVPPAPPRKPIRLEIKGRQAKPADSTTA